MIAVALGILSMKINRANTGLCVGGLITYTGHCITIIAFFLIDRIPGACGEATCKADYLRLGLFVSGS